MFVRTESLDAMRGGWFVGGFLPTALATDAAEAAVKRYRSGDCEPSHHHKVATEVTLILEGRVRMQGREIEAGTIVVIAPGESTDFHAVTDVVTVVVKVPSVKGDKYVD